MKKLPSLHWLDGELPPPDSAHRAVEAVTTAHRNTWKGMAGGTAISLIFGFLTIVSFGFPAMTSGASFFDFLGTGITRMGRFFSEGAVKPLEVASLVAVIAIAATVARTERENRLSDAEKSMTALSAPDRMPEDPQAYSRVIQLEINIFALFIFTSAAAGISMAIGVVLIGQASFVAALVVFLVAAFLILESSSSVTRISFTSSITATHRRAIAWNSLKALQRDASGAQRGSLSWMRAKTPELHWIAITTLIGLSAVAQFSVTHDFPTTATRALITFSLVLAVVAMVDIVSALSAIQGKANKLIVIFFGSALAVFAMATSAVTHLTGNAALLDSERYIVVTLLAHTTITAMIVGRVLGRTGSTPLTEFARQDLESLELPLPGARSGEVILSSLTISGIIIVSTLLAALHPGVHTGAWAFASAALLIASTSTSGPDPWKALISGIPATLLIILMVSAGQHTSSAGLTVSALSIAAALQIILAAGALISIPTHRLASGPLKRIALYLRAPAGALHRYFMRDHRRIAESLLKESEQTPSPPPG